MSAVDESAESMQTAVAGLFVPPPECVVSEDFEDSPALQALVVDAHALSPWEQSMERRVTHIPITVLRYILGGLAILRAAMA